MHFVAPICNALELYSTFDHIDRKLLIISASSAGVARDFQIGWTRFAHAKLIIINNYLYGAPKYYYILIMYETNEMKLWRQHFHFAIGTSVINSVPHHHLVFADCQVFKYFFVGQVSRQYLTFTTNRSAPLAHDAMTGRHE